MTNAGSFGQSELPSWPYRSLLRALLRSHRNTSAFMQINRALRDELNNISRRQQDFVLDVSEKLRVAGAQGYGANVEQTGVDEAYRLAIAGTRELGVAVADAHVHSIEALWRHVDKANTAA